MKPFCYLLVKTFLFFEKDKASVRYIELLCPSVSKICVQLLASCPGVSIMYVCFSNDVMEIHLQHCKVVLPNQTDKH